MTNRNILTLGFATAALLAQGRTVAFEENFNGDYSANFPTLLELDHKAPLPNVNPLFTDSEGVARPWWKLKDTSASSDAFLGSHSSYQGGGTSNDWVVSRPIEIPGAGFALTFGAQSYVMRSGSRLSDLRVYISEQPITAGNLPAEPTMLLEQVGEGQSRDNIEGDFLPFSLSMDPWAGKTVYLAFANLNTDKDILCVDNILISRDDAVEMEASSARYVKSGQYEVVVKVQNTSASPLQNWTLSLDGQTFTGTAALGAGESVEHVFTASVEDDQTAEWTASFKADGVEPVVRKGQVSGLGFVPTRKILMEESTGTWCGNCPMGMYAMELISESPELKDKVVPVSVHIAGASTDYMINEEYAYMFAVTTAPALRINRDPQVMYFSLEHDCTSFDVADPLSVANKALKASEEISLLDMDLAADFIVAGSDTTSVKAYVSVTPAITLNGSRYKVGFALTENNVHLYSDFWTQSNYYSGVALTGDLGGFTKLPEYIKGWHYNDVARAVYGYRGLDELQLPTEMPIGEMITAEVNLQIPETYKEETYGTQTYQVSPAVVCSNLNVVAYIVDTEDNNAVVNCRLYPMTSLAEMKKSIAEQTAALAGIIDVTADSDAAAEYYNLQGIRVRHPEKGQIYILKKGTNISKIKF